MRLDHDFDGIATMELTRRGFGVGTRFVADPAHRAGPLSLELEISGQGTSGRVRLVLSADNARMLQGIIATKLEQLAEITDPRT